tara:strand:- start:21286 stop:21666 length:381 start_codon:yes stop_codon:yes gene_type:complete
MITSNTGASSDAHSDHQLDLPLAESSATNQRRHKIQPTSSDAYSQSRRTSKNHQGKVLEAVRASGRRGLTNAEIAVATRIEYTTVPGCTGKLISRGQLVRTSVRRPTGKGGEGFILVAAEFADEVQ